MNLLKRASSLWQKVPCRLGRHRWCVTHYGMIQTIPQCEICGISDLLTLAVPYPLTRKAWNKWLRVHCNRLSSKVADRFRYWSPPYIVTDN